MLRLTTRSISVTRALSNGTQAKVHRGKEKVHPSIAKKDPNTQAEATIRDAEKKLPASEHQRVKTVLKGDATQAMEKAAKAGKSQNHDPKVKQAKDKLKESTFGTKNAKQ